MNRSEYSPYPDEPEFNDTGDYFSGIENSRLEDELIEKLIRIADIGDACDTLITKLKSDRRPDRANFQFHFDAAELSSITMLQIPRRLDVLLDTQYNLDGLSIDFTHDIGTELQGTGLTATFMLKEKRNPDSDIHTLIATREGLQAPIEPLADEFTYPQDEHHNTEETIQFPSLSSTDLRRLVISLMPTPVSEQYNFQNEYVQQPEHLEALMDILAKQSSDHTHTISYGLYNPIGEVVGMFTYEQFNDAITNATLEVPFDQKTIIYEIDLEHANSLPTQYNEDITDENFGTTPPSRQNNPTNTWAIRTKEYYPEQKRSTTPTNASLDELNRLYELLDNKPGFYDEQHVELRGSGDDIIDPHFAKNDD